MGCFRDRQILGSSLRKKFAIKRSSHFEPDLAELDRSDERRDEPRDSASGSDEFICYALKNVDSTPRIEKT